VQTHRIPAVHRERVIRGRNNWWFLGPGGTARLHARHLTAEGELTPDALLHLRERGLLAAKEPSIYSLTVLTSTNCNLGCGYCFQNTAQDPTGGTRPPRIANRRLSSRTISDILRFTERRMADAELDRLHVLLFGGEPLLHPRGCVELLARAADYGLVSASMISNATLLTPELARQLVDLKLESIQVTFDGDAADHDRIRVRRSGGGTFEAIVANLVRVSAEVPMRWALRVNVSHHNYAAIDALVDRLAQRLDPAGCSMHFAWVGDTGVGYANTMTNDGSLAQRLFRWQRRATEAGFRVTRPGAARPCTTCSFDDGRLGAVVNADGTLSSCWETAGQPGWQVGTVTEGYLRSDETRDRWVSCEDARRYSKDGSAADTFNDLVDAAFLDYLDETGRL
jgi:uncharacterized protein